VKKIKVFILSLVLSLVSIPSWSAGPIEILKMPVEQLASVIARSQRISQREALVLANTIRTGTELALGRSIPGNEAQLNRLLSQPGNQRLRAAFESINIARVEDMTDVDLGRLANAVGGVVDSSRQAVDICRTCGITETLYQRFGLRIYIPPEITANTAALRGTVSDPGQNVQRIAASRVSKTSASDLINAVREGKLYNHDLRKIRHGVDCAEASAPCGRQAQEFALAASEMADGNYIRNPLISTTSDFLEDGVGGQAAMADLTNVIRRINAENATPEARLSALCRQLAGNARGNPVREASFTQLRRCPGFMAVANACSL
jgi:hypothetical protein